MERKEPGAAVENSRQILVDSDAFVGWMNENDAHHKNEVWKPRLRLWVTDRSRGIPAALVGARFGNLGYGRG